MKLAESERDKRCERRNCTSISRLIGREAITAAQCPGSQQGGRQRKINYEAFIEIASDSIGSMGIVGA